MPLYTLVFLIKCLFAGTPRCTRMKGREQREQCLQRQYIRNRHDATQMQQQPSAIVTRYHTAYHFMFTFHIRLHNASSRPHTVAIKEYKRNFFYFVCTIYGVDSVEMFLSLQKTVAVVEIVI